MTSSLGSRVWTPILDGPLQDRALTCVYEIAEALRQVRLNSQGSGSAHLLLDPTLGTGTAGVALFFGYLAKSSGDPDWEVDAIAYLEGAMDRAPEVMGLLSLYEGLLGVGWVYSHLQHSTDPTDAVSDIDELLLEHLRQYLDQPGPFDLISGLVGMGVYALERLPRRSAAELLSMVIAHLGELAVVTEQGIAWHTLPRFLAPRQRSRFPDGVYNLGVAHGQPGVIFLLAAACQVGVRMNVARPLLDGAVNWLLRQQLPEQSPSAFGTIVSASEPPKPARSAWCYGDPGVATALLAAARCVQQPQWEVHALSIARKAAMREHADTGVRDTCLCHGAAGLGHLFNRLYQATGDAVFLQAARDWFARTLEMRVPGTGVAGFRSYGPDPRTLAETLIGYPGFLMGAAGIGLALLGAVSAAEPSWDRVMALSAPPPRDTRAK